MMTGFEKWLHEVKSALRDINMPFDDWQRKWHFDFRQEHEVGTTPANAAGKANRFWWYNQNKALRQECQKTQRCWLPKNHQGACQPIDEPRVH